MPRSRTPTADSDTSVLAELPVIDSTNGSNARPDGGVTPLAAPYGDLVDRLLDSQQQLTAVERFSQQHDSHSSPSLEGQYRSLIPLEAPGVDEQYSFEVDLDACSGCKACVAACHSLNGLDEGELWRNVGMLVGGSEQQPVLQHVTAACHHCLEPACMHGCPVNAYEKDPITGIVAHLDDQCIGCKYCMFMCPYDVPSYSQEKGIVRKCNMCADRLAVGEAPACVQSCPHQAIRIRTVRCEEIVDNSETDQLVPGAPDVHLTMPTTRYNTQRVLPRNLLPDDYYIAKPLHAHFPLVLMLVLTQMAFGVFAVDFAIRQLRPDAVPNSLPFLDAIGFGLLLTGMSVAMLHLGRPTKAYRALAGLRTSWLSREILGLNLFTAAAGTLLIWDWIRFLPSTTGVSTWWFSLATLLTGVIGVSCSVMLYVATKRPLWTGFRTNSLFFLTAAILGTASVLAGIQWLTIETPVSGWLLGRVVDTSPDAISELGRSLTRALLVFATIKLVIEISIFSHLHSVQFTPQRHAARLMVGDMQWPTVLRLVLLLVGGFVFPILYLVEPNTGSQTGAVVLTTISCLLLMGGEFIERYLFFAVSVARRMPGAPN